LSALTKGAACIDAGGVYVNLLPLCERIELIGSLRSGAAIVHAIEFLVVPKSYESLITGLQRLFGPVSSISRNEVHFHFNETKVELSITSSDQFDLVFKGLREAA
jgi:hypothetical protein